MLSNGDIAGFELCIGSERKPRTSKLEMPISAVKLAEVVEQNGVLGDNDKGAGPNGECVLGDNDKEVGPNKERASGRSGS